MTSISRLAIFAIVALATACATTGMPSKTNAEAVNNYGYHPVDPLPVVTKIDNNELHDQPSDLILSSLPDETMRLAIAEITGSGSLSFGPAKAGYAGRSYVVVLDYIKFNTFLHKVDLVKDGNTIKDITVNPIKSYGKWPAPGSDSGSGAPNPDVAPDPKSASPAGASAVNSAIGSADGTGEKLGVPIYVGVGLRLTANVTVNEGSIDLGNFVAIGAAAQAKQVSGTLIVQTLGVSGSSISALLPMPSEISTSSIQNAIVSLGAIKAKMYDSNTIVSPRVVGIYNNLGNRSDLVNKFITSALQSEPEVKLIARNSRDGARSASPPMTAPAVFVPGSTGSAR